MKAQENFVNQHTIWKGQQLVAEVLRFQIQQEALRDAYKGRELNRTVPSSGSSHMSLMPAGTTHEVAAVNISIKTITATGMPRDQYSLDQIQYVRVSLGTWSVRTSGTSPKRHGMAWKDLDIIVNLPVKSIHYDSLVVEGFDESPLLSDVLIASGSCSLADTLSRNISRDKEFRVPLKNSDGHAAGEIVLTIRADYSKPHMARIQDPEYLLNKEQNSPSYNPYMPPDSKKFKDVDDNLSGVFPSLMDEQSGFSKLVSDLRGDGDNHVRMLIGDIDQKSILRLGHRPNESYVKVTHERFIFIIFSPYSYLHSFSFASVATSFNGGCSKHSRSESPAT